MTATFIALLHRDLRVARRELHYFLLRVGLQPLLFTFIFGFVMPRLGIIQRGYTGMLLPGILGLSMTLSSMQAVALPLVIDFGWTKEIEDRLLAPISIYGVAIEKILVGILQAMIAGLVVLPLAWLLMGVHLSLGLVELIQLVLVAMIFFGCAYYPWATLHGIPWFQRAVLLNPLVYASEGFRLALTPEMPHMSPWLVYGGLLGFSLLFTWLGLRKFKQRAVD